MNERTQAAPAARPLDSLPASAAAALGRLADTLRVLASETQRNADETPTRDAAKLAELASDAVAELQETFTALQAAPEADAEAPRMEHMTRSAQEAAGLIPRRIRWNPRGEPMTGEGAQAEAPRMEHMTRSAQEAAGLIPRRSRWNPRGEPMTGEGAQAEAQRRAWTAAALPDLLTFSTPDICAPEESEQAARLLLVTLEALTEYDAAASVSLRADALQDVLQSLIDAHGATRAHLHGLSEAAAAYVRMQAVQP